MITLITYLPWFKLVFQKPHLMLVIPLTGEYVKISSTGSDSEELNSESPTVVDRTPLAGIVLEYIIGIYTYTYVHGTVKPH